MKTLIFLLALYLAINFTAESIILQPEIDGCDRQNCSEPIFDFKHYLESILINEFDSIERDFNLSPPCIKIWRDLRDHLIKLNAVPEYEKEYYWSRKIISSFGKSDVLRDDKRFPWGGDFYWPGGYYKCKLFENTDWNSIYCFFNYRYKDDVPTLLKVGTCMPGACTNQDMVNFAIQIYEHMPDEIKSVLEVSQKDIVVCKQKEWHTGFLLFCWFFVFQLGLPIFFSTTYHTVMLWIKTRDARKKRKIWHSFLRNTNDETFKITLNNLSQKEEKVPFLFFSLITNFKGLMSPVTKPNDIECLHAIRFLCQCWVITYHSALFMISVLNKAGFFYDVNIGIERSSFWVNKFIENGHLSVDCFFLMSGLLATYHGLKPFLDENFKLTRWFLFKFYLRRFLRLAPTYFVVFAAHVNLSPYLGQGPLYPPDGLDANHCQNDWWSHLLFLNNILPKRDVPVGGCFGHSWTLACEIQFALVLPFILYLFKFKRGKCNIGVLATIGLIFISVLTTFFLYIFMDRNFLSYYELIYIKPWTRMGSYLVGILTGYILYKHQALKQQIRLGKALSWGFTIITWLVMLFILYGLDPQTLIHSNPWENIGLLLYSSVFRVIWAVCVGYHIYSTFVNKTGVFRVFYSLSIWKHLAQLAYSAYLVNLSVVMLRVFSIDRPAHKTWFNAPSFFAWNLVLTFLLAYVVHVTIEAPLNRLENFLRNKLP